MKVAILGATKGMGREVARQMAARGDQVFLLGRDPDELGRSARDLGIRGSGAAETAICDLEDPATFGPALDAAEAALGQMDAVVITAGMHATQDVLESDDELARRLLTVNFAHTITFCEAVRRRLMAGGGGTLCVFSSVAGDRGRKPVAIYGSAKAGLSYYLEAMDHRYHDRGLRVVTIKPGFVRTGMTAGLPEPPFAGDPDQVAAIAIRAIDRGTPVTYAPGIWRLVMLVIRHLPRFIMRRVGF